MPTPTSFVSVVGYPLCGSNVSTKMAESIQFLQRIQGHAYLPILCLIVHACILVIVDDGSNR
uniref:Uncharacterized protein n=1 Tax=Oryza brachyantha TaxID=4533 RepID=J3L8K1_ORYBR